MAILSQVNPLERIFRNCVFERRYVDPSAFNSGKQGDAAIVSVTGQRFNRALTLDGNCDYIEYGNLASVNFGTGDFSVECIFSPSQIATSVYGIFISKGNTGEKSWQLRHNDDTNSLIRLTLHDGTVQTNIESNTAVTDTSAYYHLIATADRDGNGIFYLNGVADGSASIIGSAGSLTNDDGLVVGQGRNTGSFSTGNVALVRLWDRVLSAQEAKDLAKTEGFYSGSDAYHLFDLKSGLVSYWPLGNISGTTVEDIVGNNDGIATSMSEANAVNGYTPNRKALEFDGSADYVNCGNDDSLSLAQKTILAWIKPDAVTGSLRIVSKSSTNNNGFNFTVSTSLDVIWLQDFSGTNGQWSSADGSVPLSTLRHVAVKYDNSLVSNVPFFFIDGKKTDTETFSTPVGTLASDSGQDFFIGLRGGSADKFFEGTIQDLMVYNRLLTQLQVELLYKRQLRGLKL